MNVGKDKQRAMTQALANAKKANEARYVHLYRGTYWISRFPTKTADYVEEVLPNGTTRPYDPNRKEEPC